MDDDISVSSTEESNHSLLSGNKIYYTNIDLVQGLTFFKVCDLNINYYFIWFEVFLVFILKYNFMDR